MLNIKEGPVVIDNELGDNWRKPKQRGEMTVEEIAKWWTLGDEPERQAAVLEVYSNEDMWDAYTLDIEDPFFDRWRGISKRSLFKKQKEFFKKHFLEEDSMGEDIPKEDSPIIKLFDKFFPDKD